MTGLIVEILAGCVLLTWGGWLARLGAVRVARRLRDNPSLDVTLGIWFLAFPAMVVMLQAATGGSPAIALGAIAGSVTFNILVTLGVCALALPLSVNPALVKRDGSAMAAACLLLAWLSNDGALTRGDSLVLLGAFAFYAFYCCRTVHLRSSEPILPSKSCGTWCASAYVLVGAALLVTGGNLLIDGTLGMAWLKELSEAPLALTVAGALVSLPLFIIAVRAVRRGETGGAIAPVMGVNLFTLLAIPGFILYVNPIPVSPHFLEKGFACMAGAAALCIILLLTGKKLVRWEGAVFLALYAA